MRRKRKGLGTISQVLLVLFAAVVVAGGLYGAHMMFNEGTALPGEDDNSDVNVDARWSEKLVKLDVQVDDLASNDVTSGTIYVHDEEPQGWENDRQYSSDNAINSYSISSGTTTIQELPSEATHLVVTSSSKYNAYKQIELPDGSSYPETTTLNDYNQAPDTIRVKIADRYSLGSSSFDFGTLSNDTSEQELRARNHYTPDKDTEYRLERVIVMPGDQDSSSNSDDPTADSDNDGTYDAGVKKAEVEVSGAANKGSESVVFFEPANGIDMVAGNDKADMTFGTHPDGMKFNNDNTMTVTLRNTVLETEDGSNIAADDEKLSDGENVWDIQFCDVAGNCNTVAGVTG